jgi:hypothetical protein
MIFIWDEQLLVQNLQKIRFGIILIVGLKAYEERIRYLIMMYPEKYDLKQLIGKTMGCWCCTTDSIKPPLRCHCQVILKLLWEFYPELMEKYSTQNLNNIISYFKK